MMVHARTNKNDRANHANEERRRKSSPLIDLGAGNGSSDVTLESTPPDSYKDHVTSYLDEDNEEFAIVRVHFDSASIEFVGAVDHDDGLEGGGR